MRQNIPQLPQGVNYLPTTPPNCSVSPDYPSKLQCIPRLPLQTAVYPPTTPKTSTISRLSLFCKLSPDYPVWGSREIVYTLGVVGGDIFGGIGVVGRFLFSLVSLLDMKASIYFSTQTRTKMIDANKFVDRMQELLVTLT